MNKHLLKLFVIAVCIVIIFVTIATMLNARSRSRNIENRVKSSSSINKQQEKAPTTAPEAAQAVGNKKMNVDTSSTPNQPVKSQNSAKSAPQQPESAHIPFTNKNVTAGQPETYVDTVGQCPFHEIVNEKGCTPPPDIECNADWSVCTKKGETK